MPCAKWTARCSGCSPAEARGVGGYCCEDGRSCGPPKVMTADVCCSDTAGWSRDRLRIAWLPGCDAFWRWASPSCHRDAAARKQTFSGNANLALDGPRRGWAAARTLQKRGRLSCSGAQKPSSASHFGPGVGAKDYKALRATEPRGQKPDERRSQHHAFTMLPRHSRPAPWDSRTIA
jgi:hypothetical protein